ncbi:hypothetical protein HanRHA438_Chr13g0617971 [Helianthus annuus]|uniref:Uncharacterized protein n=1 Tax=Helianthus annuus TaxID=4232 RepID=A0A251SWS0_HELAN|nr:hypothetical protein HanXRQr2_Chr13g0607741 [Helianthus annuus]KAJ0478259.1 hypothetical protein HanHA300_Chr13g0498221 [Helianthus annuus]KAJ0478266.1 hypothetical protein HanHA300_Chr13g0498291 [Helianthus annuus]KAJ0499143.1 hypothetical protein HanHA89_Chr13g0530891 [Helianthus annuus]KAJ0628889.1 hypothetical protein HanIR_Chr00c41g0912991 [Helianthus annuus]
MYGTQLVVSAAVNLEIKVVDMWTEIGIMPFIAYGRKRATEDRFGCGSRQSDASREWQHRT